MALTKESHSCTADAGYYILAYIEPNGFGFSRIISETDLSLPTVADGHGAPLVVIASDLCPHGVWKRSPQEGFWG